MAPTYPPAKDRFRARYVVDPATGCWNWQPTSARQKTWARPKREFYPQMRVDGVDMSAAHYSLQLAGRPLQPGQIACHTCDNSHCVNPDHLFGGSHRDNTQDAIAKGRLNPSHIALLQWARKRGENQPR